MSTTVTTQGCPLRDQRGVDAVCDFNAILAALPPELRAAFDAERAVRQAELDAHVREHGYHT
jgi:hypothetical protein